MFFHQRKSRIVFPMNRVLYPLVSIIMQWMSPRFNIRLQLLEFQISMLRSRIDATRIVPTSKERAELVRLGGLVEHDIDDVMFVVRPSTYKTWLRKGRHGYVFKKLGRPATPKFVRYLACMMARANLRWGSRRIVGELRKLGFRIGSTTVRDILSAEDIFPEPTKGKSKGHVPWKTFLEANMDSLVATDFFTKKVRKLYGSFDAYFLVFIHLGTRKVFCSPVTYNPNEEWVTQQARNAAMWLEDIGVRLKFLIHDRNTKFCAKFREFWKDENVRCIQTPYKAPKANAYVENWIGGLKKGMLRDSSLRICRTRRRRPWRVFSRIFSRRWGCNGRVFWKNAVYFCFDWIID